MVVQNKMFQPGVVLHDAVLGSFKASGIAFQAWCRENSLDVTVARNALKGISDGTEGRKVRNILIDAAGREVVYAAYQYRMRLHMVELQSSPIEALQGAA